MCSLDTNIKGSFEAKMYVGNIELNMWVIVLAFGCEYRVLTKPNCNTDPSQYADLQVMTKLAELAFYVIPCTFVIAIVFNKKNAFIFLHYFIF